MRLGRSILLFYVRCGVLQHLNNRTLQIIPFDANWLEDLNIIMLDVNLREI